jgi:single-strand DNA-binding protein
LDCSGWGLRPAVKRTNNEEIETMLNKVFLIGNLGVDPEVRSLPSGDLFANFSLATNRRWRDRDGKPQQDTEWHHLVCFGRLAEIAEKYLSKGRQVHVEGRLHTRSWIAPESEETRYRTEIVVLSLSMLGGREADEIPSQALGVDGGLVEGDGSA